MQVPLEGTQLLVASGKQFCKAIYQTKSADHLEIGWGNGNKHLGVSEKEQFHISSGGGCQDSVALWAFAIAKVSSVVCALLVAGNLSVNSLSADESQAAICSIKVQKFVEEIDALLNANHTSVFVFDYPIRKYLPAKGCNVDEVILISKHSKFFAEAYDWFPAYTIVFRNSKFDVTFGLRKDTGDIEYPAAQTRLPKG